MQPVAVAARRVTPALIVRLAERAAAASADGTFRAADVLAAGEGQLQVIPDRVYQALRRAARDGLVRRVRTGVYACVFPGGGE